MKRLLGVVLLTATLSCAAFQKLWSHSVEASFAGAGGAGWAVAGGPAGPFIFVGMSVIGMMLGEELRPNDEVAVVTKDDKGNVTKVERFRPKDVSGKFPIVEPWYAAITDVVMKTLVGSVIIYVGWRWYKRKRSR